MTEARRWLDARTPPPPEELRPHVEAVVGAGEDVEAVLADGAMDRLGRALRRPGRVRESAFDLLLADALATYACEAALEREDTDAALARLAARLLGAGGAR